MLRTHATQKQKQKQKHILLRDEEIRSEFSQYARHISAPINPASEFVGEPRTFAVARDDVQVRVGVGVRTLRQSNTCIGV